MPKSLPQTAAALAGTLLSCFCFISSLAAQQAKVDLTHVPANVATAIVVHPRDLMLSPAMEMMPREIFSAATVEQVGIDVMDLKQAVFFAMAPAGPAPPNYGAVLRFANVVDLSRVPGRPIEVAGQKAIQVEGPGAPAMLLLTDQKTVLVGPSSFLPTLIEAKGPEGITGNIIRSAARADTAAMVVDVEQVRHLALAGLKNAPVEQLPPPLQALLNLPEWIDAIALQIDTSNSTTQVLLRATDPNAAAKSKQAITDGLAFGKMMLLAELGKQAANAPGQSPAIQRATLAYMERIGNNLQEGLTPIVNGRDLRISTKADYATVGVLTALLLPAVQAAREAARRAQAANNLRTIGLGFHNYHSVYNKFPSRQSEQDGKPLLSWRVHLLPYLEEQALYKQFHLDEPWDSEHNQKLIAEIPSVYVNPNQTEKNGKTVFLTPIGKGTVLGDDKTSIRDILDGASNTILAVEADVASAVIWTKPDDLNYDPQKPLRGLGNLRPGGFQALLADGSVHFIANTVDLDLLRALFTKAGEEAVRLP